MTTESDKATEVKQEVGQVQDNHASGGSGRGERESGGDGLAVDGEGSIGGNGEKEAREMKGDERNMRWGEPALNGRDAAEVKVGVKIV